LLCPAIPFPEKTSDIVLNKKDCAMVSFPPQ
jgi:hypothetical protein